MDDHSIVLESLDRFLCGTATRDENRRIVAHLLGGCPLCAQRASRRREAPDPGAYESALDRFEEEAAALEARTPRTADPLPPSPSPVAGLTAPSDRGRSSLSKL